MGTNRWYYSISIFESFCFLKTNYVKSCKFKLLFIQRIRQTLNKAAKNENVNMYEPPLTLKINSKILFRVRKQKDVKFKLICC